MAALQGVDIDEQIDNTIDKQIEDHIPTLEEIKARAIERLTGDKNMAGAVSQGFTPEMGTLYEIAEGTTFG